ncbi:MAG: hypothetical protein RR784_06440 [Burkholderiaceae bacterium]
MITVLESRCICTRGDEAARHITNRMPTRRIGVNLPAPVPARVSAATENRSLFGDLTADGPNGVNVMPGAKPSPSAAP